MDLENGRAGELVRAGIFLMLLALLGGGLLLVAAAPGEAPVPPPAPPQEPADPMPEALALLERTPIPQPLPGPRIRVRKSDRLLELLSGGRVVRTFPVGLGPNPTGAKRHTRDGRTPEGEYRVCLKNPESKYYLALGLSYPSSRDAEAAYREGRITRADRDAVAAAEASGSCPPWDTPLGGAIVIHGRGASADWTLGCVALEDADMRLLYDAVPVGTPVSLEP